MYWLQWRYLKRWCRATLHSQTDKHVDVDIYMEAQSTIYSHTQDMKENGKQIARQS